MGNQSSLTAQQIEDAKLQSGFTPDEIARLFKRFKKLDVDNSGSLSTEEFLAIPELEHNPLVRRVVDTFDSNKNGDVDFQEFVKALTIFSAVQHDEDERTRFVFRLYDVDGDGMIGNSDLYSVLKTMVGSNLSEVQLQQLVDRTLRQGDKDMDGKLNYEEFKAMVKDQGITARLSLDYTTTSLGSPAKPAHAK